VIGALASTLLLIAALALAWRWRPRQGIEPSVWVLLALYAVLGAWALWFGLFAGPEAEPAALQRYKPSIVYWALALILLLGPPLGLGLPVRPLLGTYFVFQAREWRIINRGFAFLLVVLGGLNLYIALTGTENEWTGFKYSYMVNVLIVLLLRLSFVWVDLIGRLGVALYLRVKALWP
jgi:intracellular septation protein